MTEPTPAPRRAPDLLAHEAAVAAWFGGTVRGSAPGAHGILSAAGRRPQVRTPATTWRFAPLAAAAALLFVLVPPAGMGPARLGASRGPAHAPAVVASSVLVIDDPSVPSLHALDTFEQLAWMGERPVGDVR
jgi:hypothetical protein